MTIKRTEIYHGQAPDPQHYAFDRTYPAGLSTETDGWWYDAWLTYGRPAFWLLLAAFVSGILMGVTHV